jgi:DNA-directed RNA polymerase specialized sigma24 family protein
MVKRQPIAFMSYASNDDKHDGGNLTRFRERLSGEVQMQMGEEFVIFQDRKHILWGQNWKERIEESLDAVTFLIPIITPSFFNSSYCREELQRFLERERKLNRSDLILPVYYVSCPLLDDQSKRATSEMAHVIATRQCADWRDLRFESFDSPQVTRTLAQVAIQIRDALERTRHIEIESVSRCNTEHVAPSRPIEMTKVELTIAMEFEYFDQRYQRLLQHGLAAFLAITPDAIRITAIEKGSVKVTIELPTQSAERLLRAFQREEPQLFAQLAPMVLQNVNHVHQEVEVTEHLGWDDVYLFMDEVQAMARSLLRKEGSAEPIEPSELVLEALEKQRLPDQDWHEVTWENRHHFFGSMYTAMRRALIDHARQRFARERREILVRPEELDFVNLRQTLQNEPERIAALTEALAWLEQKQPLWAELIQHRVYGGLTLREIARIMEVAEPTVSRMWEGARMSLSQKILQILNEQETR